MNRYPTNRSLLISIALATVALVSSSAGCSRVPCYKGYVPVTEEEALAFGQELIDRYERGDDSWCIMPRLTGPIPERAAALTANAAVLYFYGLDIPEGQRDPAKTLKEEADKISEDALAKTEAMHLEQMRQMGDPVLKGVKPMYNTYSIYFDFQRTDGGKWEQYFTVVKYKKTGEIVIAGQGMSLPKPKGK